MYSPPHSALSLSHVGELQEPPDHSIALLEESNWREIMIKRAATKTAKKTQPAMSLAPNGCEFGNPCPWLGMLIQPYVEACCMCCSAGAPKAWSDAGSEGVVIWVS